MTSNRNRTGLARGELLLVLGLAVVLLLAACGGSGSQPASSDERTPASTDTPEGSEAATEASGTDEVAEFYRGKTVRIIVGYAAGGLYDTLARFTAEYLPEYIPGRPRVIVENMEGAGSLVALNATYNVEPQDGTVITTFDEGLVQRQLLGGEGTEFDAQAMHFIGSMQQSPNLLLVRTNLGFDSFQDLVAWTEDGNELVVATTSPGALNHTLPVALIDALQLNARPVPGYKGGPAMMQALESGEADAALLTVGSRQTAPFVEEGTVEGILVDAQGQDVSVFADAAGVDDLEDYLEGEGKQLFRAANAPRTFSRPYVAGPGVPTDRVEALRDAFEQVQSDPRFLADIEEAKIPFFTPKNGAEVQQLVEELFATPKSTLDRLRAILDL